MHDITSLFTEILDKTKNLPPKWKKAKFTSNDFHTDSRPVAPVPAPPTEFRFAVEFATPRTPKIAMALSWESGCCGSAVLHKLPFMGADDINVVLCCAEQVARTVLQTGVLHFSNPSDEGLGESYLAASQARDYDIVTFLNPHMDMGKLFTARKVLCELPKGATAKAEKAIV